MGRATFTEEFRIDAIKQITERGYSVRDVSQRLGVSTHSLYGWMKRNSTSSIGEAKEDQSAESFFNLLKRERNRLRTYKTRDDARQDVLDYIGMFHNPKRKHDNNGLLSPVEFEKQQKMKPLGI